MMMANPRRNSYTNNQMNSDGPIFHNPSSSSTYPISSSILHFLKKPHAFPFLLSIFLFLTWLSLRLQRSSQFSSTPFSRTQLTHHMLGSKEDDAKANLIRFSSSIPSLITKDKRGWLIDPVSLALDSHLSGGAVICDSIHIGEIRPGALRGNHRHHTCNETLVIWGAKTRFRLENSQVLDKGYAEVIIGADEVAVAASPTGTAHALINMDPIRSAYFVGCQDSTINYSSSTSDFNVWKDL